MGFANRRTAAAAGAVLLLAVGTTAVWFLVPRHRPSPEIYARLKLFVADKAQQADAAIKTAGKEMPGNYQSFFSAARTGDWLAINSAYAEIAKPTPEELRPGNPSDRLYGTPWEAVKEIEGGFLAFGAGNEKYSTEFTQEIIGSIPRGSVYFGGTNPGRFLISAMQSSQRKGEPFMTLTQNQLADANYLDYARAMYGDRLWLPTAAERGQCIEDYKTDARARLDQGRLKPAENVYLNAKGELQIRGWVVAMEINGLVLRQIFERNPGREFYLEQNRPIDWLYPHLEPHGLIFKINRTEISELSEDVVRKDHDYWATRLKPIVGDWLQDGTAVTEVAGFAERAFVRHDFAGLNCDPGYFQSDYTCKMFGKLRLSMADLYVWRMNHAGNAADADRMRRAADLAFRQSMALCPYFRDFADAYAGFLKEQHRGSDAALVLTTADHCYRPDYQ